MSRSQPAQVSAVEIGDADVPSLIARFDGGTEELTVIATHPVPPVNRVYFEDRNRQLRAIGERARSASGAVIVAGDLNTTSWSPYFADLLAESGLSDSRRGFGIQPTWPSHLPFLLLPLDHVLASPHVRVHNRWVGQQLGSDHYPVVVDFWIADD